MNWVKKTAMIIVLVVVSSATVIARDNNDNGGFLSFNNGVRVGSVEVGSDKGLVRVGQYHTDQGYNDAKSGKPRTPPGSLLGTKRKHYNEGYDKGLAESGRTEPAASKNAKQSRASRRKQQENN